MEHDTFRAAVGRFFDWVWELGWRGSLANSTTAMSSSSIAAAAATTSGSAISPSDNVAQPQSSTSHTVASLADWDVILLASQVTLSAVAIIWLGAHGALRRPPSAAPRKGKSKREIEKERFNEGFIASDAITFPIMAGVVLIGLYYLIKWLQDPDILNKILRAYMSILSLASLGRILADLLHLVTSLVFPNFWKNRSGEVFEVDPSRRCQWLLESSEDGASSKTCSTAYRSAFPGIKSEQGASEKLVRVSWELRHLLTEPWAFRLAVGGIIDFKPKVRLNEILGYVLGLLVTIVYYRTNSAMLSNLMGAAFCYAAFIMMSPTSFSIGTLVLWGLFVYDIVMVFYTPYMITVASKLDVPIKLTFKGPSRSSMLGLGDIVIPGIYISLALRFDLWRHYQKLVKYVPIELMSEVQDGTTGEKTQMTEKRHKEVKAEYVDVGGRWGDWFWTTSWTKLPTVAAMIRPVKAATFSKTYFYAAVVGYAVGMLLTLAMLLIFNHGQPALLYLVPGVTGAVWALGATRGEMQQMLLYTEDGSLDTQDVVVELDGNGNVIRKADEDAPAENTANGKAADKSGGALEPAKAEIDVSAVADSGRSNATEALVKNDSDRQKRHHDVFIFSISAPHGASANGVQAE